MSAQQQAGYQQGTWNAPSQGFDQNAHQGAEHTQVGQPAQQPISHVQVGETVTYTNAQGVTAQYLKIVDADGVTRLRPVNPTQDQGAQQQIGQLQAGQQQANLQAQFQTPGQHHEVKQATQQPQQQALAQTQQYFQQLQQQPQGQQQPLTQQQQPISQSQPIRYAYAGGQLAGQNATFQQQPTDQQGFLQQQGLQQQGVGQQGLLQQGLQQQGLLQQGAQQQGAQQQGAQQQGDQQGQTTQQATLNLGQLPQPQNYLRSTQVLGQQQFGNTITVKAQNYDPNTYRLPPNATLTTLPQLQQRPYGNYPPQFPSYGLPPQPAFIPPTPGSPTRGGYGFAPPGYQPNFIPRAPAGSPYSRAIPAGPGSPIRTLPPTQFPGPVPMQGQIAGSPYRFPPGFNAGLPPRY
eukprot:TRINITY_DN6780_c0_g2_i3.p2 TRINITY_DN6780_c0_g2~~TRINITY_DN6780_c0_g2_i3.p2  ORF type:complete len:404 (-),score=128.42 TRINITY_DN6780_c0_g2_i3:70-1281(-)